MKRSIIKKRNRSGKADCDICQEREFLVEHHIRGRKISKPNHPSNLANICSNCHYRVHNGNIIIEQWLKSTSGPELIWHTEEEDSLTGYDADVHLY